MCGNGGWNHLCSTLKKSNEVITLSSIVDILFNLWPVYLLYIILIAFADGIELMPSR